MLEQSPGNFGNARVPYDWYQTQTHVILTIRISNLKENDVKVTIINDTLDVMCQLLDGRQFRMHFSLYKSVIVADSNWAVDTSKLVINLRKSDRKRWHSLEIIPDKNGERPKSFIGIVTLYDTKDELNNLLSAAEFDSKENSTNAITITQTKNPSNPDVSEPISLDYNWYQDEKYINILIHVPNIKLPDNRCFLFYDDDINIILNENSLNWICNLPTGVTNITFKLYKEINSIESRYELSPCRTRVEIKLKKLQDGYWPSFVIQQNNVQQPPLQQAVEQSNNQRSEDDESGIEKKKSRTELNDSVDDNASKETTTNNENKQYYVIQNANNEQSTAGNVVQMGHI